MSPFQKIFAARREVYLMAKFSVSIFSPILKLHGSRDGHSFLDPMCLGVSCQFPTINISLIIFVSLSRYPSCRNHIHLNFFPKFLQTSNKSFIINQPSKLFILLASSVVSQLFSASASFLIEKGFQDFFPPWYNITLILWILNVFFKNICTVKVLCSNLCSHDLLFMATLYNKLLSLGIHTTYWIINYPRESMVCTPYCSKLWLYCAQTQPQHFRFNPWTFQVYIRTIPEKHPWSAFDNQQAAWHIVLRTDLF